MKIENNTISPAFIKERFLQLKKSQPKLRVRDAAQQIGITEAELVASRAGDGVTRLQDNWKEMLLSVKELGKVMALTRNEYAVHERKGVYENGNIGKPHGIFVNPDIDLRLFMNSWKFAFAVQEETQAGIRHSLQFFAKDGMAIHKIYLVNDNSLPAYQEYVKRFQSDDQDAQITVEEKTALAVDKPDSEIDVEAFRSAWANLKDTHDFFPMLKKYNVGRVQALRLIGEEYSYKVDNTSFRELLNLAAQKNCEIMIFVGNTGCIQIHTGPVKNLKEFGQWYNVLDPEFNLHLREDAILNSWVVKKPTEDGTVTSLELYDKDNQNIALLFGKRKPGIPELDLWREIVNQLKRS